MFKIWTELEHFLFCLPSSPENGPLHLCLPNHMPLLYICVYTRYTADSVAKICLVADQF